MCKGDETMERSNVNLFFACDERYIPFLAVTLISVKENRSEQRNYNIIILNTGITEANKMKIVSTLAEPGFNIEFHDISACVESISKKLHTRDYYSKTTYFRLFIPKLYPEIDKALYLDCDIILRSDVGELFDTELGDNLVGAVPDEFVLSVERLHGYVTKRIGVENYSDYFNAGVLIMNLKAMREYDFEQKFIEVLSEIKFDVAQDQDYLNAICKSKKVLIDKEWNIMPGFSSDKKSVKLVHYNLDNKPWHKDDVELSDIFWQYSDKTVFANEIREIKQNYHEQTKSAKQTISLIDLAELQAADSGTNFFIQSTLERICG